MLRLAAQPLPAFQHQSDISNSLRSDGHGFLQKHSPPALVWRYRCSVACFVHLTTRSPSTLTEQLVLAGHLVFEAPTVAEALYRCERERVDAIVIGTDVEDPDFAEAQLHYITVRVKGSAKDFIWELSKLFPDKAGTIQ